MMHLTTHVLDLSSGRPARGLAVRLERLDAGLAVTVATALTDEEGRVAKEFGGLAPGRYRLVFDTGTWFAASGRTYLYPEIAVEVELSALETHYHLPLLLAPFGYSTYRGS